MEIVEFDGFEEVSVGFTFTIKVNYKNQNFDYQSLLGKSATVTLKQHGEKKIFNGIINQITACNKKTLSPYQLYIELVPWFFLLKKISDCRVFEDETAPEIFAGYCGQLGFADFNFSCLKKSYPKLPCYTQYNESTYQFLCRLLNEFSIFFFFSFEERRHVMVLCDSVAEMPRYKEKVLLTPHVLLAKKERYTSTEDESTTPIYGGHSNHSYTGLYINSWSSRKSFIGDRLSSVSFDFKSPNHDLVATHNVEKQHHLLGVKALDRLIYPGNYKMLKWGDKFLKRHSNTICAGHGAMYAESSCARFSIAKTFSLSEFCDGSFINQFFIIKISHRVVANDRVLPTGENESNEHTVKYASIIKCIPSNKPFLPAGKAAVDVRIDGVQSAMVIGEGSKQGNFDQWGRVKVRLFWDRNDGKGVGCKSYLRVAQISGGGFYGSQFLPRDGDEVLLSFINGDPYQPLVIRSMQNNKNQEYSLFKNKRTVNGFKVWSTENNGHELAFDDAEESEKLTLSSQGKLSMAVRCDFSQFVQHNELIAVDNSIINIRNGGASLSFKKAVLKVGSTELLIDAAQIKIKSGE